MIPVSSAFKEAMKRPVKELDAYIRIDENNSITSADDLISIKVSCDSGLCKAAMRKLEAKYTGEHNLLGQWVHVGFGVILPSTGTFDYLDYGSFLITEIKTSKDTDVTEIVAYDKMINAMTKYEELDTTYPKGLFAYTQLICQACNLTLGNESFATNNNWQVTEELWKNINGITYRDILQQIAQVTGTTCIISNDDKVYFKTINTTGETLTYDNLLKLKLEPVYGEINSVVLSREPITGEDVFMKDDASILANGLTEFKIDNNQLVDKRREDAISPIYNALHGINYYPFEASTEGLGWYEIGDNFDIINDTNDTYNTTLFNFNITVDGGIKETLKTNAETKTQTQYEYASKTSKRIANTEVTVDKQNKIITELVETTDEITKEIKPTQTASGSSINLDDGAETELIDFELEGKTTQETRSGKNLLKYPYYATLPTTQAGVTWEDDNGKIIASGTATGYSGFTLVSNIPVQANTNYRFYIVGTQTNVSIDISGSGLGINIPTTSLNNSGFVFNTGNATAITLNVKRQNSLSTSANFYPMLVIGTDTSTDYEPYGQMPSPDYPSKLNSVGYENIINFANREYKITNYYYRDFGTGILITEDMVGKVVSISYDVKISDYSGSQTTFVGVIGRSTNNSGMQNNIKTSGYLPMPNELTNIKIENITIPDYVGQYLIFRPVGFSSPSTANIEVSNVQLTYSSTTHTYIPYGKYGIEVKTIGKNLFDKNRYQNLSTSYEYNIASYHIRKIQLEPNTNYTVSHNAPSSSNVVILINNIQQVNGTNYYDLRNASGTKTITTDSTGCLYIGVVITFTNEQYNDRINECNIQIEKGNTATTYEAYKENSQLYTLDEPLRSIGDTKDLLYIKNGMLYVERKIGSVVLDGSENWGLFFSTNGIFINSTLIQSVFDATTINCISNYFNNNYSRSYIRNHLNDVNNVCATNGTELILSNKNISTANDFKTWLSTHNTEVQYILAEPYTEEVGQVQMPSTYKGITYINTADDLEPNMNITYVRDTLIANYVESHVSELKITEQGIETRVQTIEESDYGGQISAVEERTTSTEKNIEVISTNIDTTTGEVRKVTTINGMTFDENGLNIHTNQNEFNTQITNEATEYRDGDSLINKTSRDGSLLTKLRLQGETYYSCNGSDATNPMNIENFDFVDERIEVDGEYCYATFYNGEE